MKMLLTEKGEHFWKVVTVRAWKKIESRGRRVFPEEMQAEMKARYPKEFHGMTGIYVSHDPLAWAEDLSGSFTDNSYAFIIELNVPVATPYLWREFETVGGDEGISEIFLLREGSLSVKRKFTIESYMKVFRRSSRRTTCGDDVMIF